MWLGNHYELFISPKRKNITIYLVVENGNGTGM